MITHYNLHMRSHEGPKFCCKYCGKSFVKKQSHDYHLYVHTGQYKFICDKCKDRCNGKKELFFTCWEMFLRFY